MCVFVHLKIKNHHFQSTKHDYFVISWIIFLWLIDVFTTLFTSWSEYWFEVNVTGFKTTSKSDCSLDPPLPIQITELPPSSKHLHMDEGLSISTCVIYTYREMYSWYEVVLSNFCLVITTISFFGEEVGVMTWRPWRLLKMVTIFDLRRWSWRQLIYRRLPSKEEKVQMKFTFRNVSIYVYHLSPEVIHWTDGFSNHLVQKI